MTSNASPFCSANSLSQATNCAAGADCNKTLALALRGAVTNSRCCGYCCSCRATAWPRVWLLPRPRSASNRWVVSVSRRCCDSCCCSGVGNDGSGGAGAVGSAQCDRKRLSIGDSVLPVSNCSWPPATTVPDSAAIASTCNCSRQSMITWSNSCPR